MTSIVTFLGFGIFMYQSGNGRKLYQKIIRPASTGNIVDDESAAELSSDIDARKVPGAAILSAWYRVNVLGGKMRKRRAPADDIEQQN
jgi:hypothetical protein